jgi:uncharacterized phiE125 gp8 family phage protein
MGVIRITKPVSEPVTVAEAKAHCRVTHADDDAWFPHIISTAREVAEARCSRSIGRSVWQLTLDEFPSAIPLPNPRVLSITTLKYRDPAGVLTTLDPSGYTIDNGSWFQNWVYPSSTSSWPDTWVHPNGVIVTYEAGFLDEQVPSDIRQWMLLAIGAWYDVRAGMDLSPLPMQAYELPPTFFSALLEPWMVTEA